MRRGSTLRTIGGVVLWAVAVAFIAPAFLSGDGAARDPAVRSLRFLSGSPRRVEIERSPDTALRTGDPVFVRDEAAFLVRVGRVETVDAGAGTARLAVHPEHGDLLREGARARAFTVPTTAAWVAETLLPPERLGEIREELAGFIESEGDGIRASVWPHLKKGLVESLALFEKQLPGALARNSDRWKTLFARHREGPVEKQLLPALREVTFVIAEERFSPYLKDVGAELWKALPLWGLGWRAVWEKVPFTAENQVRERFEKYLRDDARPILAARSGEAARIAGEVIRESLRHPRIQKALGAVFRDLLTDPEFGALLGEAFDELIVENEELHNLWRERWEAGLSDAISDAAGRLEPVISRIVDSIALSESRDGLNPRLVRVLRARVLRKDCRWVLLTPGTGRALPDGAHLGAGGGSD